MRPSVPVITSSQGFLSSSSSTLTSTNVNSQQVSIAGAAVISNKPVLYLPEKEPKSHSAASSVVKAPLIKKLKVEEKASSLVKATTSASVTVSFWCYI